MPFHARTSTCTESNAIQVIIANKTIRKILKVPLELLCGKLILQPFFERLHKFALWGMNYHRNSGNIHTSGEMRVIKNLTKEFSSHTEVIMFDVGANVGRYSIALAEAFVERPILIYSFEPSADTFGALELNTAGIKKIICHKVGLSDKKGVAVLYKDSKISMANAVYPLKIPDERRSTEFIQLTTLDEFCQENKIGFIHFLKLDIEGHEINALLGAKRMIQEGRIQVIQFEFSFANVSSQVFFREIFEYLSDKYELFRIVKNGLYPMPNYDRRYEIFQVANFIAKLKMC